MASTRQASKLLRRRHHVRQTAPQFRISVGGKVAQEGNQGRSSGPLEVAHWTGGSAPRAMPLPLGRYARLPCICFCSRYFGKCMQSQNHKGSRAPRSRGGWRSEPHALLLQWLAVAHLSFHLPGIADKFSVKKAFIPGQEATVPLESASGLVVKSIVAIDGPRVRFAAGALFFAQCSSTPILFRLFGVFRFGFFAGAYRTPSWLPRGKSCPCLFVPQGTNMPPTWLPTFSFSDALSLPPPLRLTQAASPRPLAPCP